jgi:sugar phosphate isomerase/epimerase
VDPRTKVGIGHFTMLGIAPPELVTVAADAGFDFVGVRTATAATEEEPWPMAPGSPMFRETLTRLEDRGLEVYDVEIVRLTPDTRPADATRLLESGAGLGARFVNVFGDDPDLERAHDTLAELVEIAAPFGLRPLVEGTSYTGIQRIQDVATVSTGTGGGVIIDPLHLHRTGGTAQDVRELDHSLLGYYQLCDAPLETPTSLPLPVSLPRNQPLPTSQPQIEARAARLLPGEGQLPLVDIVSALPPELPVSAEVPNLALYDEFGPAEYAKRVHRATVRVLELAIPQTAS